MGAKIIGLFPGQGSQHVGMAKDLFENFRAAQLVFEEASDATHVDLRKLCFEGPESDLVLTENTQPCLLTASVAAFRVAQAETGIRPFAVAGHSLGEYSALVAADVLPLSTTAVWVKERGKAMQNAVPAGQGSMAAVLSMDDAKVSELCSRATESAKAKRSKGENADLQVEAVAEPANFNSPGQIVIAGSRDAVAEAVALIKAGGDFAGSKAIPLSVSAPFHCRLMKPARERMAELFSKAGFQPKRPSCPYVPNRTARLTEDPAVVFELLVEQVDHPVLWAQSARTLLESSAAGDTVGIEFGPGKVLTGLFKRIAQASERTVRLANLGDSASMKAVSALLSTPITPSPGI